MFRSAACILPLGAMLAWSSPSEAKNAYGYGFEFGETPAAQGIAEWDAYLKKKLVARGFRGPRMKPKTVARSKDGKFERHCWDFTPNWDERTSVLSCLYVMGGKIVGGKFPGLGMGEGHPNVDFLKEQGFSLLNSYGAKQLGFSARNDHYRMGAMRANYIASGIYFKYNTMHFNTDLCFYPAAAEKYLPINRYICNLK